MIVVKVLSYVAFAVIGYVIGHALGRADGAERTRRRSAGHTNGPPEQPRRR